MSEHYTESECQWLVLENGIVGPITGHVDQSL